MKSSEYSDYILGEFAAEARNFILRTGQWSSNLPTKVLIEKLNVQMEQVREECLELFTAYGTNDLAEIVDGIIDVAFVWSNFDFMVGELKKLSEKDPKVMDELEELINGWLLDLIAGMFPVAANLKPPVGLDVLLASAKLIIANNRLKYTDSEQEVLSWVIDNSDGLETGIQKTIVDGTVWYSLVDKNGKVRKHKHFKKVQLEDLVRGANES